MRDMQIIYGPVAWLCACLSEIWVTSGEQGTVGLTTGSILSISPTVNLLACFSISCGAGFQRGRPGDHQEPGCEWEKIPTPVPFITAVCGNPVRLLEKDSCYMERGRRKD